MNYHVAAPMHVHPVHNPLHNGMPAASLIGAPYFLSQSPPGALAYAPPIKTVHTHLACNDVHSQGHHLDTMRAAAEHPVQPRPQVRTSVLGVRQRGANRVGYNLDGLVPNAYVEHPADAIPAAHVYCAQSLVQAQPAHAHQYADETPVYVDQQPVQPPPDCVTPLARPSSATLVTMVPPPVSLRSDDGEQSMEIDPASMKLSTRLKQITPPPQSYFESSVCTASPPVQPPSCEYVAHPQREYVAQPPTDRITQPSPDHLAHPSPAHLAQPSPDHVAQPSPDHVAQPSPDHVAQPSPEHMTQPPPMQVEQFPPEHTDEHPRKPKRARGNSLRKVQLTELMETVGPHFRDLCETKAPDVMAELRRREAAGIWFASRKSTRTTHGANPTDQEPAPVKISAVAEATTGPPEAPAANRPRKSKKKKASGGSKPRSKAGKGRGGTGTKNCVPPAAPSEPVQPVNHVDVVDNGMVNEDPFSLKHSSPISPPADPVEGAVLSEEAPVEKNLPQGILSPGSSSLGSDTTVVLSNGDIQDEEDDILMDEDGAEGGGGGDSDPKKGVRAERNRRSAAASRDRKKLHLKELEHRVSMLSQENAKWQVVQLQTMIGHLKEERKSLRKVKTNRTKEAGVTRNVEQMTRNLDKFSIHDVWATTIEVRRTWDLHTWQGKVSQGLIQE